MFGHERAEQWFLPLFVATWLRSRGGPIGFHSLPHSLSCSPSLRIASEGVQNLSLSCVCVMHTKSVRFRDGRKYWTYQTCVLLVPLPMNKYWRFWNTHKQGRVFLWEFALRLTVLISLALSMLENNLVFHLGFIDPMRSIKISHFNPTRTSLQITSVIMDVLSFSKWKPNALSNSLQDVLPHVEMEKVARVMELSCMSGTYPSRSCSLLPILCNILQLVLYDNKGEIEGSTSIASPWVAEKLMLLSQRPSPEKALPSWPSPCTRRETSIFHASSSCMKILHLHM